MTATNKRKLFFDLELTEVQAKKIQYIADTKGQTPQQVLSRLIDQATTGTNISGFYIP